MTRMGRTKYIMASCVIALVLWAIARDTVPVTPILPEPPQLQEEENIERNLMIVELVWCESANLCLFNIKGEEGILGRSVPVYIHGFNAPQVNTAFCPIEKYRGIRARARLMGHIMMGELTAVVKAWKRHGSPFIEGRLLVDGRDVTQFMIESGLAAPPGIKVDWCEESPKEMEI